MPDALSKAQRSAFMSKIRSGNTVPEILFRKALFKKGLRYRINVKNLPGKPDIVLKKFNLVILVHGCFWHHHRSCKYAKIPKSNIKFWKKKIYGNVIRDVKIQKTLKKSGWRVITVWECNIRKNLDSVVNKTLRRITSLNLQ